MDIGYYKGAIDDFSKSIQLKNDYAFAFNNRAIAKYKLNDNKGSVEDCSKAIELDPLNGYAYLNRGIAREMLRDDNGACADWKKAKELGVKAADNYSGDCK